MNPDTVWGIFFLLSALPVGWFIVWETFALVNKSPGDTLSEHIRKRLGIDPPDKKKRTIATIVLVLLIVLPIWFIPHIYLQIW